MGTAGSGLSGTGPPLTGALVTGAETVGVSAPSPDVGGIAVSARIGMSPKGA